MELMARGSIPSAIAQQIAAGINPSVSVFGAAPGVNQIDPNVLMMLHHHHQQQQQQQQQMQAAFHAHLMHQAAQQSQMQQIEQQVFARFMIDKIQISFFSDWKCKDIL